MGTLFSVPLDRFWWRWGGHAAILAALVLTVLVAYLLATSKRGDFGPRALLVALAPLMAPFISGGLYLLTRQNLRTALYNVIPTQSDMSVHLVLIPSCFACECLSIALVAAEAFWGARRTSGWKRNVYRSMVGLLAAAVLVVSYLGYHRINAWFD